MIILIDQDPAVGLHGRRMLQILHNFCVEPTDIRFVPIANTTKTEILSPIISKIKQEVSANDIVVCPWVIKTSLGKLDLEFTQLAKKCAVLVPAGNTKERLDEYVPARVANVITVAALNKSGQPAGFNNYSDTKNLFFVPGTNYEILPGDFETGTCVSTVIFAAFLHRADGDIDKCLNFVRTYTKYVTLQYSNGI